tara:strand:- start:221 stop:640 length:420 start_codon:yes stop_codon:yes gene_type:complete
MLLIKYNDLKEKNIIIKKNNKLYLSNENFTLNSFSFEVEFYNVFIHYNKCYFNNSSNMKIIKILENIENKILNNYLIKNPIYNLKKNLNKNIIYIKNFYSNKKIFYKNISFIFIINGISENNNYSFINFYFINHPLNNN